MLTIELEKALSQTGNNMQPTKTWSPYRDPLAKFLNKYSKEVAFSSAIDLLDSGVVQGYSCQSLRSPLR